MNIKIKYYFFAIVLGFFVSADVSASDKDRSKAGAGCTDYVLIQGSSNINKFEFINYSPEVTHTALKPRNNEPYKNIQIPVYKFSGSNSMMLDDFYKMLKASEYPFIKIAIEPRELADFDEGSGLTNFRTEISIAGKSRSYVIPCEIVFCDEPGFVLKGDLALELSDFEIDPPKKVFGTVKVDNEVFITFAFRFAVKET